MRRVGGACLAALGHVFAREGDAQSDKVLLVNLVPADGLGAVFLLGQCLGALSLVLILIGIEEVLLLLLDKELGGDLEVGDQRAGAEHVVLLLLGHALHALLVAVRHAQVLPQRLGLGGDVFGASGHRRHRLLVEVGQLLQRLVQRRLASVLRKLLSLEVRGSIQIPRGGPQSLHHALGELDGGQAEVQVLALVGDLYDAVDQLGGAAQHGSQVFGESRIQFVGEPEHVRMQQHISPQHHCILELGLDHEFLVGHLPVQQPHGLVVAGLGGVDLSALRRGR
mmetsp:Transcript_25708/g.52408  ORF Transcript_25708/g.52408 Transcript_25708/m.52408 type:complete len:281 (-) Transcript_25708:170-1012(-)